MTIMVSSVTIPNGAAKSAISSFFFACCSAPVLASRASRLSGSMLTGASRSGKWLPSTPSCVSWTLRTARLSGSRSQLRVISMPPALV